MLPTKTLCPNFLQVILLFRSCSKKKNSVLFIYHSRSSHGNYGKGKCCILRPSHCRGHGDARKNTSSWIDFFQPGVRYECGPKLNQVIFVAFAFFVEVFSPSPSAKKKKKNNWNQIKTKEGCHLKHGAQMKMPNSDFESIFHQI